MEHSLDYEVGRCTRRCAASDVEFKPGDQFYSVLLPEGAEVVRKDYAAENWPGATDEAICWWKSEMPDVAQGKVTWAPNDAILNYFLELVEKPTETDQLYILALLMIRKRIVRLEETERQEDGQELMLLYCPSQEKEFRVRVVEPTAERIAEIQTELAALLFSAIRQ